MVLYEFIADERTFLFDGGLPRRKLDERSSRYQSLLYDYIQQSTNNSNKNIPSPFVVLVCQQALLRLSREHRLVVRVVAGEADDFCVCLAREDDTAIIVSADGDFLIYVSETGNFAPLQRFPLEWDDTISFPVYSKLREGLGIAHTNGMVEVAALLREASLSVAQCIACVKRNQTLDHISRETLNEYVVMYMATKEFSPTTQIQEILDHGVLSGRLTELFFADKTPTMWLPLLPVSNPPRKTAWAISQFIRQSAYWELQKHGVIHGNDVIEIVHRGQRVAEELVSVDDAGAMYVVPERKQLFIAAMEILLENVSDAEKKYLPTFAGMFVLLQQSSPELRSTTVPAPLQYITLQYQAIIYSFTMLLQTQYPSSTEIPEFATLWDLPRFKMALSVNVAEAKSLWHKITESKPPNVQNLFDINTTSPAPRKRKARKSNCKNMTPQTNNDQGNRFSSLAM